MTNGIQTRFGDKHIGNIKASIKAIFLTQNTKHRRIDALGKGGILAILLREEAKDFQNGGIRIRLIAGNNITQIQQIVPGHKRITRHRWSGKVCARSIELPHRFCAKIIADHQPAIIMPGTELRQAEDRRKRLRIKADRTRRGADISLKTLIANMGNQQTIGRSQQTRKRSAGYCKEWTQVNLFQLIE